jgi:hypothetical protein
MFLAVSDTFDPRRHPRRPDGTFAPAPPPAVPDSGLAADLADVLGGVDQVEARAGIDDPAIDHALAVQTEPPRPPDSDDDDAADWWYEHGKTWVKNTATPDDLERVVDDYWDDGYGVPEAIAQAVYRDDCPTEVVAAVLDGAHMPSIYERWAMALNTPPEDLAKYARMPDRRVRLSVAGNPNTPPAVLTVLAVDTDKNVRAAAARNPNLPAAGRSAAGLLND